MSTKASEEITNREDIIDSRDVIARIAYLEGTEDEDEKTELKNLEELEEQCSGYMSDWKYGVGLIRDSYFEEYAKELASDIGAIKDDAVWPCMCIDWERAADELKMDYTSVEFDGVTYWGR